MPAHCDPEIEKALLSLGFYRESVDFKSEGKPRPIFVYTIKAKRSPNKKLVDIVVKAIIGDGWTTIYRLDGISLIAEMSSVRTSNLDAIQCTTKRVMT